MAPLYAIAVCLMQTGKIRTMLCLQPGPILQQAPTSLSITATWPRVRAISFDLDNTLWPIEPAIHNAERQLWNWLNEHHPRITEQHDILSMREHRLQTARNFPEMAHDIAGLRRQSLECLLTEFDYADDLEHARTRAEAGWRVFYDARHQIEWYDDALPALTRLQAHYTLAATSNGNANLELLGIAEHFSTVLHAGAVGYAKPHPQIWQALCDAMQLQPEQILHIGDSVEEDTLGALRHGLPAVWLDRGFGEWPEEHDGVPSITSLDQLLP